MSCWEGWNSKWVLNSYWQRKDLYFKSLMLYQGINKGVYFIIIIIIIIIILSMLYIVIGVDWDLCEEGI